MIASEFEDLITAAGLNLLSRWAPRFGVSLHVAKSYGGVNGVRMQNGTISFASHAALEAATTEECQAAIDEMKARLFKASQTKQGNISHKDGGEVKVVVEQEEVAPVGINYPAH